MALFLCYAVSYSPFWPEGQKNAEDIRGQSIGTTVMPIPDFKRRETLVAQQAIHGMIAETHTRKKTTESGKVEIAAVKGFFAVMLPVPGKIPDTGLMVQPAKRRYR